MSVGGISGGTREPPEEAEYPVDPVRVEMHIVGRMPGQLPGDRRTCVVSTHQCAYRKLQKADITARTTVHHKVVADLETLNRSRGDEHTV